MKIILGKIKSGKTNELIKMFLEDKESAVLISDNLDLVDIIEKIQYLQLNYIDIVDILGKKIITNANVNCVYLSMVQNPNKSSIYLDMIIPFSFRKQFKNFCVDMENKYGYNIILIEQVSSEDELKGLKIIEYKGEN